MFIAYSQFPETIDRDERGKEAFQGVIDKGLLVGCENTREEQEYVQRVIETALQAVTGMPYCAYVDSLGLRLTVAAIGQSGLDHLVHHVARGWTDIEMSALTSGFSG